MVHDPRDDPLPLYYHLFCLSQEREYLTYRITPFVYYFSSRLFKYACLKIHETLYVYPKTPTFIISSG